MTRHSTANFKRDDDAFPIRIKVAVPDQGLGQLANRYQQWLRDNLDPGYYAWQSSRSIGMFATAFYFTRIEDAVAFLAAFPETQLADATDKLRR